MPRAIALMSSRIKADCNSLYRLSKQASGAAYATQGGELLSELGVSDTQCATSSQSWSDKFATPTATLLEADRARDHDFKAIKPRDALPEQLETSILPGVTQPASLASDG